jgi:hypothetical protein
MSIPGQTWLNSFLGLWLLALIYQRAILPLMKERIRLDASCAVEFPGLG